LAGTQHLHLVGADLCGVALVAVLVGPLARAQRAFDIDLRALAQVLAGDLGQRISPLCLSFQRSVVAIRTLQT
jgi:hypothetical protein